MPSHERIRKAIRAELPALENLMRDYCLRTETVGYFHDNNRAELLDGMTEKLIAAVERAEKEKPE